MSQQVASRPLKDTDDRGGRTWLQRLETRSEAKHSKIFEQCPLSGSSQNRAAAETSKLLKDELLFQRATQTYRWACLINTLGMKFEGAAGGLICSSSD